MNFSQQEMTGYCGLYCGDCLRFNNKASEFASLLADELEIIQFQNYAEVKKQSEPTFSNHHVLPSLLNSISALNCTIPCRAGGDGCSAGCTIIGCVNSKSISGCWQCETFEECEQFDFLKPFHGEANIINLRLIVFSSFSFPLVSCFPFNCLQVSREYVLDCQ